MPIVILVGLLSLIPAVISLIMRLVSNVVDVLVQPLLNLLHTEDPQVPLSAEIAADMVERNIIDMAEGTSEAGQNGINPHRFSLMVKDTGEPYGIEQALSLYRRGKIDLHRFTEVLYYSRVRNEFLPDVLDLAHQPMSAADAIEAVLKAIISDAEGKAAFERAGGIADEFDTLLAAAGNPIGVEQANALYLHGRITHEQLVSVIRHSRINPQFESMAELLRFHYIPAFQIVRALSTGSVNAADATRWLTEDGYPADQVAALVHAGSSTKVAKHKGINEAQIIDLYEAGAIDNAQAHAQLVAAGYEASEVDFILAVYDQKRTLAMAQAAVGQVRKQYLARRIDHTTASNLLDALHVEPALRDHYLALWDIEREAELRSLTMAQVGALYKKGSLSGEDATARWEAMGYSSNDAGLLLDLYAPKAAAGTVTPAPATSSSPGTSTGGA